MPDKIDKIDAFLSANPAARAWIEEVLVRGAPGDGPGWGVVKGVHFVIGVETIGPTGDPHRTVLPPIDAAGFPDDETEVRKILGVVLMKQQATLDAVHAKLAASEKAHALLHENHKIVNNEFELHRHKHAKLEEFCQLRVEDYKTELGARRAADARIVEMAAQLKAAQDRIAELEEEAKAKD